MKENIWIFGVLLLIVSFFFDSEITVFMEMIRVSAFYGVMRVVSYIWFVGLIIFVYCTMLKDKKKILLLGLSVVIAYVVSFLLKLVIMRERPENLLRFDYSFPSSHAIVMFSTLAMMNKEFPKLKYWFFGVALVIAFSRLYLGVHYASDLVAGGFLGYGIGLLVLKKKAIWTKLKGFWKS
ncbi:MAG: phosphatase PAP2 family protein [Nanoarchaeota archaeon]|nr:phosphatase PAP2 family protein [Nanoarchaeota archaeon]